MRLSRVKSGGQALERGAGGERHGGGINPWRSYQFSGDLLEQAGASGPR